MQTDLLINFRRVRKNLLKKNFEKRFVRFRKKKKENIPRVEGGNKSLNAIGEKGKKGEETTSRTKEGKVEKRGNKKGRRLGVELVTITSVIEFDHHSTPFPSLFPPLARSRAWRQQSANALMETSVIRVYSLCTSNYPFPRVESRSCPHIRGSTAPLAAVAATRGEERRGEELA